jgi:hypothetical protein
MRAGTASHDEHGRYSLRQSYGAFPTAADLAVACYRGVTLPGRLWETMPDLTLIAAAVIFGATYAFVAVGEIPVYRIDRVTIVIGLLWL